MESEKHVMYDMYPEWGPAAHDEDHPAHPAQRAPQFAQSVPSAQPVQRAMDRRDNGGERPDDN